MAVSAKIFARMSVDEFLNWDSGDALRYELVDGEPRAMTPANRTNGTLQGRLATLINNHLDRENRPCSLVVEPGVVPHLLSDHNVRVAGLGGDLRTLPDRRSGADGSGPVDRNPLPEQSSEDLDQYLSVHEHSERSGNSGPASRSDRS